MLSHLTHTETFQWPCIIQRIANFFFGFFLNLFMSWADVAIALILVYFKLHTVQYNPEYHLWKYEACHFIFCFAFQSNCNGRTVRVFDS